MTQRKCIVLDVSVEFSNRGESVRTVARGYAGRSPGDDGEFPYTITLKLAANYEALQWLQAPGRPTFDPAEAGMQRSSAPTNYVAKDVDITIGGVRLKGTPEGISTQLAPRNGRSEAAFELCRALGLSTSVSPETIVMRVKELRDECAAAKQQEAFLRQTYALAIAEIAAAAGFEKAGEVSAEDLSTAIAALRSAALPPYEPQTAPLVDFCKRCGQKTVVRQNRKTKKEFTGCSAWPACNWIYVPPEKPADPSKPEYARRKLEID